MSDITIVLSYKEGEITPTMAYVDWMTGDKCKSMHKGDLSESLEAVKDDLKDAVSRIKDMLLDDDGQAYKEAEKFLDLLEKKNSSE